MERQKHENLLLKETIDRLRFEIDELRNSKADGAGSTGVSRAGTLAPSLAAEMQQTLLKHAGSLGEGQTDASTGGDGEYVETVITRRMVCIFALSLCPLGRVLKCYAQLPKKPRTSNESSSGVSVQEIFRDYTDASTQHNISEFTAEAFAQTLQSEASSSTAGPSRTHPTPVDAPPSYSRLVEEEAGLAEVAKWHSGRNTTDPLPQGISTDAVEEWKRLKSELGFSCLAIDEVVQKSEVNGPRPGSSVSTSEGATLSTDKPSGPGSLEPVTKWTMVGLVGAFCLFSCEFCSRNNSEFMTKYRSFVLHSSCFWVRAGDALPQSWVPDRSSFVGYRKRVRQGWSLPRCTASTAAHAVEHRQEHTRTFPSQLGTSMRKFPC